MRAQLLARSLIAFAGLACASSHIRAHAVGASGPPDATWAAYEQYGFLALPFGAIGHFYFLAGATPDSTKVLLVVARVPSDGLALDLTRGGAVVHQFHMMSPGAFRETLVLAPGVYDLTLGSYAQSVVVPRLGRTALAQPIPMRTTAIIGRDTAIDVYVEVYGASDAPVTLSAPGWCDTLSLDRKGDTFGDVMLVPLSRLAPGPTTLVLARGHDSAKSMVFVGFSDPVPASFEGTLDVLRYLASPGRLDSLRNSPADQRPRAWASFMAVYGSRLPDYLSRVREADRRFSEGETPGWKTDRGGAYLQLGDPDQVFVEPDIEIWVYTRYFGRLEFDHKRLVSGSHDMLETLIARARSAR